MVAHVRPDSGQLAQGQQRLAALGLCVQIDTTPWDEAAMVATLAALQPRAVYCLIGTTRKTAARAGIAGDIYQAVDVALCRMLAAATAAVRASPPPRFILLSSVGAGPSRSAYLQARYDMEQHVRAAGLAATIVRPSVILAERDEHRRGEAFAGAVGDGMLAAFGLFAPGVRARYRSIRAPVLARQLVEAASDTAPWRVVEAQELARESSAT